MRALAAISLLAVVCASPYVMVNGSLTSKKDVGALFRGLTGGATAAPDAGRPLSERVIGCAGEIGHEFVEEGLRYVFLVPLLLGLFAASSRPTPRELRLVFLALASFHLLLLIVLYFSSSYVSSRHVMIPAALCMPWIGKGAFVLGSLAHGWIVRRRPDVPWLTPRRTTTLLVGMAFLTFLPWNLRTLHESRLPMAAVADWVRASTEPGDWILTTSKILRLYADREGRRLDAPGETLDEIKDPTRHFYAVVVLEGIRVTPDATWLSEIEKRYVEREIPGISGGKRRIRIFLPRPAETEGTEPDGR